MFTLDFSKERLIRHVPSYDTDNFDSNEVYNESEDLTPITTKNVGVKKLKK